MKKTSLILHGHFYQPPRENPRTGIIEIQESAAPYDDWNERIWDSCYRANANSRYLDPDGTIRLIRNNYESLSFNFGPTLFSWMEANHPDTVQAIIEADRKSVERLGHGNAIAQGFNHTILPLDDPEDADLEITWALDAFRRWFGRESEGFWCPECAINPVVVDLLAAHGVKFVILSPWQCQSVENEQGTMVDLKNQSAPSDKPYILTGPKGGQISAFFYDPELASGISFGHFLRNADDMYTWLLERKEQTGSSLIQAATDGEIYGHHEPYGDMALCALIDKVGKGNDFVFTNYATYLAGHPATLHAVLKPGEANKGTSWSCIHGVSRWYKDCGCHTGGEDSWNQKWRTPLREAFRLVHAKVMERGDGLSRKLTGLPLRTLVGDYGPVAAGQETVLTFMKRHGVAEAHHQQVAMLCEMVQYSMYSFTSCGWFFNDLNGLEPRQDIDYSLYSIQLYQDLFGDNLLEAFSNVMDKAKCNLKKDGSGKTIVKEELKVLPGAVEAALAFYYGRIFSHFDSPIYGKFRLDAVTREQVRFCNMGSLVTYTAICQQLETGHADLPMVSITLTEEESGRRIWCGTVDQAQFPKKLLQRLRELAIQTLAIVPNEEAALMARNINAYSKLAANSPSKPDILDTEAIGLSFVAVESMLAHASLSNWDDIKEPMLLILHYLSGTKNPADRDRIVVLFKEFAHQICENLLSYGQVEDSLADSLTDFLHYVREERIPLDLTETQETIWNLKRPDMSDAFRRLLRELNFSGAVWHA